MNKEQIENDSNYESLDGFSTKIWGNPLWFVLHMITFNYPVHPTKQDKLRYRTFFQHLGYVLPCRVCRENYQVNNKKIPLKYFRSRHTLARYIYKVHQDVPNQPSLPVSFYEMRQTYELFRASCSKNGCQKPIKTVKKRTLLTVLPIEGNEKKPALNVK